jgi:hypothetical protein
MMMCGAGRSTRTFVFSRLDSQIAVILYGVTFMGHRGGKCAYAGKRRNGPTGG